MSEYRDNCSKDAGEEKIREFVKNSTRVYPHEFEPFLRFTSINAVPHKLAKFKKKSSRQHQRILRTEVSGSRGCTRGKGTGRIHSSAQQCSQAARSSNNYLGARSP